MLQWSVQEIANIVGGNLIGSSDFKINEIVLDSRKAKSGDLFVPLIGENYDGHLFINHAFQNGALAAFSARHIDNIPDNCCVIVVDDPLLALQSLGKEQLKRVDPLVIAVTGSTGKTTTKEMIATILAKKYNTFKSKGNLNSEQGLPLSLCSLADQDQIAVLEMGMRGKGQIAELVSIAPPDIAVITNIGTVHLELLGTQENLARAKGEILSNLSDEAIAILNGDDQWCQWLSDLFSVDPVLFGLAEGCDVRAKNLAIDDNGCYSYDLNCPLGEWRVQLPVAGKHQVYNSLAGIAVALQLGMSQEEIVAGIAAYQTISGRQQLRKCHGLTLIDDTYNSNPDSIRASLELLKLTPSSGRRIAVLGDMRELGSEAESSHLAVGRELSQYQVDILICVNELGALIGYGAREDSDGKLIIKYAPDNQIAAQLLKEVAKSGDLVLIKGSRSLEMEQIVAEVCKGLIL